MLLHFAKLLFLHCNLALTFSKHILMTLSQFTNISGIFLIWFGDKMTDIIFLSQRKQTSCFMTNKNEII